jgi:hypothetical protein
MSPARLILAALIAFISTASVHGQDPAGGEATYRQIKAFSLTGGSAEVTNLVLKRDRVEMTLTGTFAFAPPVNGRVTGAVFTGQGHVKADVPPSDFEKDNVRRLLGADLLESDFKTAVLRMTDDTFDAIDRARSAAAAASPRTLAGNSPAPPAAQHLAEEFEPRLTRETGINLSARLATSLLNGETPGVFFAEFDGGRRGRFDFVLDPQMRIPTANFAIDGGEKGLFFRYEPNIFGTEVWMAFYAQQDYDRAVVPYADKSNLVDITNYQATIDVRSPSSRLGISTRIDMKVLAAGVRGITFRVGEGLGTYQDARLKRQLRLKAARLDGQPLPAVQEDWEGGFTVFLPAAAPAGSPLTIEVDLEGNFMDGPAVAPECFYLLSNEAWMPRHGVLDRATFDLTFYHAKRHVVASVGERVSEAPDAVQKDVMVTKYRMDQPVSLVAFAVGQFERSKQMSTTQVGGQAMGGQAIPLEYNGVSAHIASIKNDFIFAEMDNAIRFFSEMFGKYPYPVFGAVIHPYGFGQGFPSLLFLAPADTGTPSAFSFIAHETSHQWWGNVVAWRSYRDQWLSEGFAEYSAWFYTGERTKKENPQAAATLIRASRTSLLDSPRTTTGIGKGRVVDIGPIILGHRLATTKSGNAYTRLIYDKGALVLRMLHFLLTNPTTGDGKPFFTMMSDFVERYRNGSASTEDFFKVAGEHFAKSPVGVKYGLTDLEWFSRQWVRESGLPSYSVEYEVKQEDASWLVSGTVKQDGVPDTWVMPLPIKFTFAGNQTAKTVVRALGASFPFQLKLPSKPVKVELDPDSWVLSEKTSTKGK